MEPTKLSVDATDEIILKASRDADGAIEDCEERDDTVVYFFASGAVGTVSRVSGDVTIKPSTNIYETSTGASSVLAEEVD